MKGCVLNKIFQVFGITPSINMTVDYQGYSAKSKMFPSVSYAFTWDVVKDHFLYAVYVVITPIVSGKYLLVVGEPIIK